MFGPSREELFENAAAGLFSLMTDPACIENRKTLHLELTASSVEELFVNWLSELVYRSETGGFFFGHFRVHWIGHAGLKAEIGGEAINSSRHVLKREIKAVTRHALRVEEKDGQWQAAVIFDV